MNARAEFDSDIVIAFAKALAAAEGDPGLYGRVAKDTRTPEDAERFKSCLRRAKDMLAALASGNEGLAVIPTTPPEHAREAINDAVLQNIDMHGDWIGQLEWQTYLWKAAYLQTVRTAPFAVTPHGVSKGSAMPGDRLDGVADTPMVILPLDDVRAVVDTEEGATVRRAASERIRGWLGED